MSDSKHRRQPREEKDPGGDDGRGHGPYWRHAHRDWRLWIVVLLMLGAMAIYLISNDLSVRPAGQPSGPGTIGK